MCYLSALCEVKIGMMSILSMYLQLFLRLTSAIYLHKICSIKFNTISHWKYSPQKTEDKVACVCEADKVVQALGKHRRAQVVLICLTQPKLLSAITGVAGIINSQLSNHRLVTRN